MAEEEKKEGQEEQEPKKAKKSFVKWIVVAFLVIGLGAGGFAGWKFYTGLSSGEAKQEEKKVAQKPGIWSLGSLVVNLMDNNGERYLKTTIQLEVSNQESMTELEELRPKVTDSILVLLSSKTYKEIAGFEGKQSLRDEIAVRTNRYMTKGQVKRIYFTEFLIQ